MTTPSLNRRAFGALSVASAAGLAVPAVAWAQADGAALGHVTLAVGGQGVLYHLPLALADGPSSFTVAEVTRHLTTNIAVIQTFLDRPIECHGEEGEPGTVEVK